MALTLSGSFACEQMVTISGNVTVPVEVQQRFGPETKGRLVVLTSYAESGGTIGGRTSFVFCGAGSAAVTVPFNLEDFGCISEINVEALVFPIADHPPEKFLASLPCGPADASPAGAGRPQEAVAYGRQVIWQGRRGGGCKSGTQTVEFAVSLKQ
jgi:hypothetical protein